MTPRRPARAPWDAYLRQFHDEQPGITEDVLLRCRHDDRTPYQWLTHDMADHGVVLDLACGSAPTRGLVGPGWIGLDTSLAELRAIRSAAPGRVALGDVAHLPFRSGCADTAICSMALMLVEPIAAALGEITDVLRPGGTVRLLLPARGPLTAGDRVRYANLLAVLGTVRLFPSNPLLRRPAAMLKNAGLSVAADNTSRFAYPVRSAQDAVRLVDSLYLPRVSERRRQAARRLVSRWAGRDLGVPLRRVIAVRKRRE